jgi:hypothetical protein
MDGSGLQRELPFRVDVPAPPAALVRQEDYFFASAGWARNAIGPATGHHALPAIVGIGEIYDCFL